MLTEAAIKSAIKRAPEGGKKQIILKDAGQRGSGRLALVVRPMPARVLSEWYAIFFRDGKRGMTKIGAYPAMSLADARAKFRNEYEPTIRAGGAPKSAISRQSRSNDRGATVAELFQGYADHLKAVGKESWKSVQRMLIDRPDSAANEIGRNRLASSVKASDVSPLLAEIYARGKPVMAAHMRAYIGAAFRFGIKAQNDYRNGAVINWGVQHNPVDDIPADGEAKRVGTRVLTEKELRHFWRWLVENEAVTIFSASLRLQIITGQRVREVLRMREHEFAPGEAIYEWEKTKNGMPHAIPLPGMALEILGRLTPNKHGLYFPNKLDPARTPSDTGANKICMAYCEEAKIERFTPRDLRRTWKTLAGKAGISKDIRDRLQNHARADVSSKHYDRYDYMTEKRSAMETWETFLQGILSGDK